MDIKTDGEKRRKIIFDLYVNQLQILFRNNLLPKEFNYIECNYVCPICLQNFTLDKIKNTSHNMLTLEDAPPKALGGKANVLTCKECNNHCGQEIDNHLANKMKNIDKSSFKNNTKSKIKSVSRGVEVGGIIETNSDGIIKIKHDEKHNNPKMLSQYITSIQPNDIIEIEFNNLKVDAYRFEVALLKSAYILAFEKFGYTLILDESYNIVREQILNPDKRIYPSGFWTTQSFFNKLIKDVYIIDNNKYSGIFSIFSLSINVSEIFYGVYLPKNKELTEYVIYLLRHIEKGFKLPLKRNYGIDFIKNENNIINLHNILNN